MPQDGSPRILISRLSAIGDVIHALPVLCALRERFPLAMLAWVVESRAAALLRGHPDLDHRIELPRRWFKNPRGVWRLRQQLRALHFDRSIDVQGLTKSALVGRLSGASRRIGFADAKGRELSRWLNNEKVACSARHIIDANLELLRPLGIESPEVRFNLPEHEPDRQSADRIVDQMGVEAGFALLNPGAGWTSKLWPTERFAAVARHISQTHALTSVVVWAGDREQTLADRIVSSSLGTARKAPPTSLTELAALARRSRLFVGSDTGPLHLAAAVGTPCVGLYGPMPAERNGPYGSHHISLQQVDFEGTSRERREAPPEVMAAITVEMVNEACDRILRRSTSRTRCRRGRDSTSDRCTF